MPSNGLPLENQGKKECIDGRTICADWNWKPITAREDVSHYACECLVFDLELSLIFAVFSLNLAQPQTNCRAHPQFKGGIDCRNTSIQYSHSLSKERRKRELQRITKENQQILRRIQNAQPAYNHVEWEEEARKNDKILENISEFKTRHGGGRGRGGGGGVGLEDDSIFGYMDYYDSIPEWLFEAGDGWRWRAEWEKKENDFLYVW